jgi:hypothetical protein
MTQADFTIANQTFPNTRTELNTSLQALATNSAGNSAPSTTFPNQWHFDSDGNQLYIRNKDNDAWVKVFTIGATSDKIESIADSIAIASTGGVTITTADNTNTLSLISTDADANAGPNLNLYRNSSSPADNDTLGLINFVGRNDNSQDVEYAKIRAFATDVSDGSEDVLLAVVAKKDGTDRDYLKIGGSEVVFNEDSVDVDFRVESNGNANMLVVDGELDVAAIGGAVDTNATLLIHTTITDDNTGLTIKGAGSGTGARLAIADAGSTLASRAETLEIGYDNSTDFIFSRTGQDLVIGVNSSEVARFKVGGGIALGGTGAVNTLDDYEEGTWTIILEDQSDNAVTLNTNSGTYIKIGGQVTITGFLTATSLGSASSALRISGLPFNILGNSRNYAAMTIGYAQGLAITAGTSIAGIGIINSNNVNIVNFDVAAGSSNLVASKFSADGGFVFTMTYTVV